MRIPVNGTPEFAEFYQSLSKNDKLYKELDTLLEALAENPKLGDLISFEKIPQSLEKKYPDLDNLLRAEVNRNWRLLYTLVGWLKNKTVYVLMAMPHKEYDQLFGY
ncbi:MAG: hypothetical protein COW26_01190 [Nitrosopumilales archaeon CG15_BIG_FIL_POST_REV_8_21_14_020_33_23]|nr:MAG: hypothetical protein COW26_01190 [Nitrosopumilales archaeon CG15_BIG_FIL_POST_REV_8_21_14_020_33_23]